MNPSRFPILATAVLVFAPAVALAQQSDLKGKPVTFRACVTQGIPTTTIRLTDVTEAGASPQASAQVVYWIDKAQDSKLREHLGTKVEIAATVTDVSNRSVSELTANDGVFAFQKKLVAPPVVAASNTGEESAVGTSGSAAAESESRLLKIAVDKVRMVGSCP